MSDGKSFFSWKFDFRWYEFWFAVLAYGFSCTLEDYTHSVSSLWVECRVTEKIKSAFQ